MGAYYVEQAQVEALERELESGEDEGEGLFEVLVKAGRGVDERIMGMIEGLLERVMSVVGDVEIPEEDESEDGSEGGNGSLSAKGQEGWDVTPRELMRWQSFGREENAPEKEFHKLMVGRAVHFLDRCIENAGRLTELELWEVLDECRDIVKQFRGKNVVDGDSERCGLEGKGSWYRNLAGNALASSLAAYRELQLEEGRSLCPRVYKKALKFIELVEKTMKSKADRGFELRLHGHVLDPLEAFMDIADAEAEEEVLQLAQIILDSAKQQHQKDSAEIGVCGCCRVGLCESLDALEDEERPERGIYDPLGIAGEVDSTITEDGSFDEEDTLLPGESRLTPIHEDPEAEAESERESLLRHVEDQLISLAGDGNEVCEIYLD